MKRILAYSGGADSGAVAQLLTLHGLDFTPVFCDTGWEHPLTYAHIAEFNDRIFSGSLVTLRSEEFRDMPMLVQIKKRVPSAKARFCTEKLKVLPMQEYVRAIDDEVTIYQGLRRDESPSRQHAQEWEWSDAYDCWVERPILNWTKQEVFEFHKDQNLPINPLYLTGASRVGCFPCVLINQGELRLFTEFYPEIWDRMAELERAANGSSFFPPNYIPQRFHSGRAYRKTDGSVVTFPTLDDVRRYVLNTDQQKLDYAVPSCMSLYNLCE